MSEEAIYQIRDAKGLVLAEYRRLVWARIASIEMNEGVEIIEKKFINGGWEEVVLYARFSCLHPKEQENEGIAFSPTGIPVEEEDDQEG